MKCKTQLTPFMKQALRHRAVEYAVSLACSHLAKSHPGNADWRKGISFLRSAYEDSKTYIEIAPPDQRQMKGVLNWHIVLTFVIRGPEIGADLTLIQVSVDIG